MRFPSLYCHQTSPIAGWYLTFTDKMTTPEWNSIMNLTVVTLIRSIPTFIVAAMSHCIFGETMNLTQKNQTPVLLISAFIIILAKQPSPYTLTPHRGSINGGVLIMRYWIILINENVIMIWRPGGESRLDIFCEKCLRQTYCSTKQRCLW